MRKTKKVFKPVKKSSNNNKKDKFMANLNLSTQPIVCLNRLNMSEFPNNGSNNFTINIKSESFLKLGVNLNDCQTRSGKSVKRCNSMKPKINRQQNKNRPFAKLKSKSFLKDGRNSEKGFEDVEDSLIAPFVYDDNSCTSKNESMGKDILGNKENQCSPEGCDVPEFGFTEENEIIQEPDSADNITRTDTIIDTFLHVLRKSTDDNSILSALQRDYICDNCQQGFLKKGTLRKHMRRCYLGDSENKSKRRKKKGNHSCPMCGITYLNKHSLDKHNANVHSLRKMYKCLVCSEHFYNEGALTLHCRSRHGLGGPDIYKCPYCDSSFSLRGDLNYHCRKAHNTNQYYICSKCLECFKSEETCKLHELSHGHICDICMYTTKDKDELMAHRSTHLYMVVHKCDRCSRTFKAKRYFTKHIKVHERERKL